MAKNSSGRILYAITEKHVLLKADYSSGRQQFVVVDDAVEKLNTLWGEVVELSDKVKAFHERGGAGYEITIRCLKSYLTRRYGNKNPNYEEGTILDFSALYYPDEYDDAFDIFEVIGVMGIDKKAERYFKEYNNRHVYSFMAALTFLIDSSLEAMENSLSVREQEFARVLRCCYMEVGCEDFNHAQIAEMLQYDRKSFYKTKEHAITALSKRLYGDVPGETGLHNFTTDEEGHIIFRDMPIKLRKSERLRIEEEAQKPKKKRGRKPKNSMPESEDELHSTVPEDASEIIELIKEIDIAEKLKETGSYDETSTASQEQEESAEAYDIVFLD